MKIQPIYKILLFLFLCVVGVVPSMAQSVENTTHIKKEYAVDDDARIEISNKYGNVHINTWDKDSVLINISYTIKARDARRYNKLKESLDFEFVETTHYIIVRTVFLNSGSEIVRDLSSALTSSSSSSIEVNYEVFVPEEAKLHISNKYGDVYTTDLKGDVTFELGYGVFNANNFSGHTDLNLNNCKANINHIEVGIISLSYSEVLIGEAGSVKLNSHSSETRIHTIESITIDGKSDEIRIENCGKANVSGNFSKFEMNNLSGNLNASTKYGDLDIYLSKEHKGDLILNCKYTNVMLRVYPQTTNLSAEIRHQRSKMIYPAGMSNLTEEKISSSDVLYHSSGTIGNGKAQSGKLTLFIESGDLNIYPR